ncbi:MAG TPA: diguanylate cyclase [Gemmatimonadaceae bacterium]|nr:diguanylate cyclase [Gemmatimonadaceae bacterium]
MDKARILIADEDFVLSRTLTWLLRDQGYEVDVAPGGRGVLDHLKVTSPDLLMIDVGAEPSDGYQLLERMRGEEQWRDMPVLVLSPQAPDEASSQVLKFGATDFLSKPFHVRELLARVRMQLKMRREILHARSALRTTEFELAQVRTEAEKRRQLVDIMHEVHGDFSSEELYHILVRRVAHALDISHCSLILAHPGDETGVVAAAYETPGLRHLEIQLSRYPEVREALEKSVPVLVEDVENSPLYAEVREEWAIARSDVKVHSVIALPFGIGGFDAGVVFLRTLEGETPLTAADVEFADDVVKAAVSAIQRAQMMESTRADNERLEVLALTDALTQTLNRRALMDRLESELDRARRYSLTLSLLMVDLDHFKTVNDTFGHLAGDEALRGVARVLQREARSVDVVARYGGEEFVVILPETGEEGAVKVAERIRARVAEQPSEGVAAIPSVTVSVGVATVLSTGIQAPEEVIALADEALYRAKAQGRNRVCT